MALDLDINIKATGTIGAQFRSIGASLRGVTKNLNAATKDLGKFAGKLEKAVVAMARSVEAMQKGLVQSTKDANAIGRLERERYNLQLRLFWLSRREAAEKIRAERQAAYLRDRAARDAARALRDSKRRVHTETRLYQIARRMDLVQRSAARGRQAMASIAVGGVSGYAIGRGVRGVMGVDDQRAMRESRLATALLGNFEGVRDLEHARSLVPGVTRRMQEYAASTPGDLNAFVSGFERLAPQVGLGIDDLMKFVQGIMVGGARNRPEGANYIINDVQQMLEQGTLTYKTAQDLYAFLNAMNPDGSAEKFWKENQDRESRVRYIQEANAKVGPEIAAINATFQARSTALGSHLLTMGEAAGKSFATAVNDQIGALNTAFETYGPEMLRFLTGASSPLGKGGAAGVATLLAGSVGLSALTAAGSAIPIVGGMFGGLASSTAAATAAASGATLAGTIGAAGTAGIATLATGGAAVALTAAGTGVIVASLMAVAAAVAAVVNAIRRNVKVSFEDIGRLGEHLFVTLADRVVPALGRGVLLFSAFSDALWDYFLRPMTNGVRALASLLTGSYGTGSWERVITDFVNGIDVVASGVALVAVALGKLSAMLTAFVGDTLLSVAEWTGQADPIAAAEHRRVSIMRLGEAEAARLHGKKAFVSAAIGYLTGAQRRYAGSDGESYFDRVAKAKDRMLEDLGSAKSITNIDTVNVQVKTETMDDPQRVAAAFDDVLAAIQRRRRGAPLRLGGSM